MPFAGAVPMTASRVLGLSWYSAPGIIQRDGKPAPQIRRTKIMSDNRKYYYLKLKESYFDDDAIVLLESIRKSKNCRSSWKFTARQKLHS